MQTRGWRAIGAGSILPVAHVAVRRRKHRNRAVALRQVLDKSTD